jgi:hypothetical protein
MLPVSLDLYVQLSSGMKVTEDLRLQLSKTYPQLTPDVWGYLFGVERMASLSQVQVPGTRMGDESHRLSQSRSVWSAELDRCRMTNEFGVKADDVDKAIAQVASRPRPRIVDIAPVPSVRRKDGVVTVTVGTIATDIPEPLYDSITSSSDNKESVIVDLALEYAPLGLGSSLFSCVGSEIYQWMEQGVRSGVTTIECFASPFDRSLKRYCSLGSHDPDSLGNFFKYIEREKANPSPHLFLAYPPDHPWIIHETIVQLTQYVQSVSGSGYVLFMVRAHPELDAVVDSGSLPFYRVVSKGYHIYYFGETPDINLICPPSKDMDSVRYEGLSLISLMQSTNMNVVSDLLSILKRVTGLDISTINLINSQIGVTVNPDDKSIYTAYRKAISSSKQKKGSQTTSSWTSGSGDAAARAKRRVTEILPFIEQLSSVKGGYADIGSADGSVATGVKDVIRPTQTLIIDVKDEINDDFREGIVFAPATEETYASLTESSLKLVTFIVSLHHIPTIKSMLTHIFRALIPGGIVLIREHAFKSPEAQGIIMAEHILYDYCVGDKAYEETLMINALYPRDTADLTDVFTTIGYELVTTKDMGTHDYIYTGVFRKPNTSCERV